MQYVENDHYAAHTRTPDEQSAQHIAKSRHTQSLPQYTSQMRIEAEKKSRVRWTSRSETKPLTEEYIIRRTYEQWTENEIQKSIWKKAVPERNEGARMI